MYDLVISPKDILSDENNKEFTINTLCEEFGLDRTELIELIESKSESQYQIITSKKGLVTDEIENFNVIVSEAKEAAKKARYDYSIAPVVRGVWFEERYARKYPMGTSACNVIGFTDGDIGNNGIEEYYNDELTGSYGREYGYFNSELDLERTVKPAVNGNTVVSSIDANVQQIVENKIKILEEEMGAENIAVMLMNPQDGEVLAMASNTVYDLNNPRSLSSLYTEKEVKKLSAEEKVKALSAIWKNFCISNTVW